MLKKDITLIYMDSAEKAFMQLIAAEAQKRGYQTRLTDDKFARCEIGIYCQHVNFPQYSKFSLIMLHDIIQQYGSWPDIWAHEPWNKYDIGILPSDQWVENWNQSSQYFYARPRLGMYKVGWPKADVIADIDTAEYKEQFCREHGLDPQKKTVLYAPAWENDHKQDDFVQAMLGLDVNILIKQWDADPAKFPQVAANIKEMEALHRDIPGVTILPPATNIFYAILASDILVSEESSTMSEAAMVGVPAVSVSDWLIPDVTPSRYPECNYDFVVMTKKAELRACVGEILRDYDTYRSQTGAYAQKNFANVGKACGMILDIIDDAVAGRQVRYEPIRPQANRLPPIKKLGRYWFRHIKREIRENYCERSPFLMKLWRGIRFVKRKIKGEEL